MRHLLSVLSILIVCGCAAGDLAPEGGLQLSDSAGVRIAVSPREWPSRDLGLIAP